MADEAPNTDESPITFNVKSSADAKYVITVPLTTSVLDLKKKLAGEDYANVPPESQRLIYSGRVLKDGDPLATYKVKEGNTIHLVKSAASNARQNPANSTSSSATAGASPGGTGVPTNMAAGTGRDPLASLTGARYAGYAQMPNANMFGPDGGMGPPPDPEQMASMMENPAVAAQMNAALSNPDVVDQIIRSNPMLSGPMGQQARQMLNDPNFRRMLTDPEMMRNMNRMRGQFGGADPFGGAAAGGNAAFPMPGSAEPGQPATPSQPGQEGQQNQTTDSQAPPNPFAAFGAPGGGPAGANPFAALFGGMAPPAQGTGAAPSTDSTARTPQPGQQQQGQTAGQQNPFQAMAQMMMQNPQAMQQMMGMMGGGSGNPNPGDANAANPQQAQNPFAALQQMGLGGFNPATFGGYGAPSQPPDDRPPEDRFADQLRQLNDMGFFSFERNVEALRRTGGSVQGAVEYLLNNP